MKNYEFKEHTADIIAHAWGDTLESAMAAAARAMFDIITAGAEIRTDARFEVKVESIDLEGLLVAFLSDLIVIHETESVVMDRFQIVFESDRKLTATCFGESFDPARHGSGTPVKGVSYHMLEIDRGGPGRLSRVQVLFDV